jgi:hypothetical protein
MDRQPSTEYVAAILRERWGNDIPWRERTQRPIPPPPEDELTKARRRRVLNEAMDDAPQEFRRFSASA